MQIKKVNENRDMLIRNNLINLERESRKSGNEVRLRRSNEQGITHHLKYRELLVNDTEQQSESIFKLFYKMVKCFLIEQTAHFSVQSVSSEIKISDSFKIRDFEDNETGFSSVSPLRKNLTELIFSGHENPNTRKGFSMNPKQTRDFSRGYKSEGFGDIYIMKNNFCTIDNYSFTSNPSSSTTNSLPLNSLTEFNSGSKPLINFSASGGCIVKTIMPWNWEGGNKTELRKSLSRVRSMLSSSSAKDARLLFLVPFDAYRAEYSLDSKNFLSNFGIFSSSSNFVFDIMLSSDELGCPFQSICNHLFGQARVIISHDFLETNASTNKFDYIANQNPRALESGLSMTDLTINNDVLTNFNSHIYDNKNNYINLIIREKENENKKIKIFSFHFLMNRQKKKKMMKKEDKIIDNLEIDRKKRRDIENCIAYVTSILQFSICLTALCCAISNAVIHSRNSCRSYHTHPKDKLLVSNVDIKQNQDFILSNKIPNLFIMKKEFYGFNNYNLTTDGRIGKNG